MTALTPMARYALFLAGVWLAWIMYAVGRTVGWT